MSEVALEPCPFCGGQAERVDIDDGENAGGSCIQCTQCLASGNVEFGYKENFVSNWNRRKAAASSRLAPGEIAKLVEWLQTYSVLLRRGGCADDADFHEEAAASLTRQTERVEELERALERIYRVGDGYGPHRPEEGRHAGTTGEGHARCREIAAEARRARSALDEGRAPSVPGAALDQT